MKVVGCKRTGWLGRGCARRAAVKASPLAAAWFLVVAAWAAALAWAAAALLMAGCSAGVTPGSPAVAPGGSGVTVDRASAPGGFSVFAEPSPAANDLGQAKLALSVADGQGGFAVAVEVRDARNLKAVLAGLRYDALRWHPESAEFTQALGEGRREQVIGDRGLVGGALAPHRNRGTEVPPTPATDNWQLKTAPASDVLSLAVLTERGVVHLAQALAGYTAQPGLTTQNAVIARVRFSPGAVRTASAAGGPPVDSRSKPELSWDYDFGTLTWAYVSKGDGDRDGVVTLADILPLARYFGETYYNVGASFPWNTDGDDNYEINFGDLTFIARNFGASARGGYDVFRARSEADYPATPDAPNGSSTVRTAHVPFATSDPGDGDSEHAASGYAANVTVGPGDCFWVRPLDEQGHRGTPSAIAFAGDLHPPLDPVNQQALSWNATSAILIWYYHNCGDFDQNRIVLIHDVYSVGQFYHDESPSYPDPFPEGSAQSAVDGNRDGRIDLSDITQIPLHLYSALTGYNVYASADIADYEACASGPSVITPIGHVAFYQAQGDTMVDRLHFSFHLASPQVGWYYWVRPELWGQEGVESQVLQVPAP